MKVQAAFFDIDGTLVDSNDYHVSAWEEAFRDHQHPIAVEAIRKQIGQGADMLIPALLPGSDPATRESMAKRHDEIFNSRYLPRVKPFPYATELIASVQREGIQVVLASSAKGDQVEHYVELLKVRTYLQATTSADNVEKSKPAGDLFASALQKVAPITARESLAVGDTPYDVISAAKCGIKTIALLSGGFSETELLRSGAIAIYDSVGDLLANLKASALTVSGA